MLLVLVRHGETAWNRENRVQGTSDTPLSDNGIRQAERLASSMAGEEIDLIVTSPLRRAAETASIINRGLNAPLRTDEDLRELDQGIFEGMGYTELMRDHGDFLRRWAADPASVVMPGGESLSALEKRAWGAVQRTIASSECALIVSHNFTITVILCRALGIPLSEFRRIRLENASISVLDFRIDTITAVMINDTAHLK
ncbi:MAG: histidine phosphatase family protein [Spirochaetes bacterium]|nr:histidine phosphatase family protein [Spirochaetota bacterium]